MIVMFKIKRGRFRWHVVEVSQFPNGVRGVTVMEFSHRRGAFWRWAAAMRYAEFLAESHIWEQALRERECRPPGAVDVTPDPGLSQTHLEP